MNQLSSLASTELERMKVWSASCLCPSGQQHAQDRGEKQRTQKNRKLPKIQGLDQTIRHSHEDTIGSDGVRFKSDSVSYAVLIAFCDVDPV